MSEGGGRKHKGGIASIVVVVFEKSKNNADHNSFKCPLEILLRKTFQFSGSSTLNKFS